MMERIFSVQKSIVNGVDSFETDELETSIGEVKEAEEVKEDKPFNCCTKRDSIEEKRVR